MLLVCMYKQTSKKYQKSGNFRNKNDFIVNVHEIKKKMHVPYWHHVIPTNFIV